MIEFKGECGHTIRSKDQDAGGVVRCSYCGRPANVPDQVEGDDLGAFFGDIEPEGSPAATTAGTAPRQRPPRRKRKKAAPRHGGEFNPFAFSLKLCYGAALIIVLIVVIKMFIVPVIRGDFSGRKERLAGSDQRTQKVHVGGKRPVAQEPRNGLGLRSLPAGTGLYVSSVPTGAAVCYLQQSKAPATGRIDGVPGCRVATSDATLTSAAADVYVVEVRLPVLHKTLKRYPGYAAFRRDIESNSLNDVLCSQLMRDYFLPDGASRVYVEDTGEQVYFIRQYRDVEVAGNEWGVVRSLFLPRIAHSRGSGFSVEALFDRDFLSKTDAYQFDVDNVRGELLHYGVPREDCQFVLDSLSSVGAMPFQTPDGGTWLFKIQVDNGMFKRRMLEQAP